MKCTVAKDDLNGAIRRVINVVSSKTTLPVLRNILLEADGEYLTLTTTDLEVSVQTKIKAIVTEGGSVTVPGKKFAQVISSFPAGDVHFELNDNMANIKCQKSKFKIPTIPSSEFPLDEIGEDIWEFTVKSNEFRRNIGKISYACCADEARRAMTGILLSLQEGIMTLVATDGRRLALVEKQLEERNENEGDVILPPKVVSEIQRVLDSDNPLRVEVSDSRVRFSFDQTVIASKLIEGNYPNFRQAVPLTFSSTLVIKRDELEQVMNRVGIIISEMSDCVLLKVQSSEMLVSGNSKEFGESEEPLDVSYDGEPVELVLNHSFLLQPVKHMESDEVIIYLNDSYTPVKITGDEGFLCIVMPLQDE